MSRRVLVTGGSGFIGTHLVERLRQTSSVEVINLDIARPKQKEHLEYWRPCDIMSTQSLLGIFSTFQPDQVVHLAARTDMEGKTVEDYAVNSQGTENVAHAVKVTPSVARVIFTSTQYVVRPGALPAHDRDFRPHTIYGESKVLSEKAVRSANLSCIWTIVRPTNVWGSWHPRYPREFWLVLKKGLYLHPGSQPVIRSYGYVGNVVLQLERILHSANDTVNGKVLYVGDEAINLLEWVNAFSVELTGRKVRVLPRAFLRSLAWVGDAVIAAGGRFPIFTSRLRSMTENYQTPMSETFTVLGKPEIPLREGVRETVTWLRTLDDFRQP